MQLVVMVSVCYAGVHTFPVLHCLLGHNETGSEGKGVETAGWQEFLFVEVSKETKHFYQKDSNPRESLFICRRQKKNVLGKLAVLL